MFGEHFLFHEVKRKEGEGFTHIDSFSSSIMNREGNWDGNQNEKLYAKDLSYSLHLDRLSIQTDRILYYT